MSRFFLIREHSTNLRPSEVLTNSSGITYGVVGFIAAVVMLSKLFQRSKLDAIPTVGSGTWLGCWWTAFKYIVSAQSIVQEGYKKYKSAPFRIPEIYHWTVVISSRRSIEELARASDEDLSFLEAIDDQIHIRYTLGHDIIDNPYHVEVIRSQLTRNLEVLYPEIRNEMVTSFDELLDLRGNEWKSISVLSFVEEVVCRTSNRLFVGLPLCRNPDWIDLNIHYTMDTIKGGAVIGLFPVFMRSLATRLFTNSPRNIARAVRHLGSIIEERRKYIKEYGTDWDDKPNDLVSWLMEQGEGPKLTVEQLANRVLVANFASIPSSSNFFTQVLCYLAANPQYIQPLREEVEGVIETDGWSKAALGKMRKVDSFLRECLRIKGINIVTVSRKAMKDFTFSDGTFIPKGTMVAAPAVSLHLDADLYKDPEVFEPFRFSGLSEEDAMKLSYQFASTSTEYLAFGFGKHACPGRFFAANELKSMLAHVVSTYDVKLEDDATCPTSWSLGHFIMADTRAKVMFRHRVD